MSAQAWIKTALKNKGLKLKDVAETLSITPPRVTDIIQDRREVQADEIVPLAGILGLSVKSLLASLEAGKPIDLGPDETGNIEIKGLITGTGIVNKLPEDYPIKHVPVPPDASDGDGLFCYIMGDDSLDQEIKHGSLVIAADPRNHFFPMVPGALFLIKTKTGGLTIRQLYKGDAGDMWMVPRPTTPNPAYESFPFSMLSNDMDQAGTKDAIRPDDIIAGVMWVHRRYAPEQTT